MLTLYIADVERGVGMKNLSQKEALRKGEKMDAVSRQGVIEIIKNYCENGCDYAEDNWCPSCQREKFVELLKALPSTQPEIIRCKDCLMHGVCRFEQGLGLDGYCSQAERRTDE